MRTDWQMQSHRENRVAETKSIVRGIGYDEDLDSQAAPRMVLNDHNQRLNQVDH